MESNEWQSMCRNGLFSKTARERQNETNEGDEASPAKIDGTIALSSSTVVRINFSFVESFRDSNAFLRVAPPSYRKDTPPNQHPIREYIASTELPSVSYSAIV